MGITDPRDEAPSGPLEAGILDDVALVAAALAGTRWADASPRILLPKMTRDDAKEVGQPLADVLPRLVSPRAIQNVSYAFASAAGSPWASQLLELFEHTENEWARDRVAFVIHDLSVKRLATLLPRIISLVEDRSFGNARAMLARTLPRIGTDDARAAVVRLLRTDDPEIGPYLLEGCAVSRTPVPATLAEPYLAHKQAWVRKAAKRLLDTGQR